MKPHRLALAATLYFVGVATLTSPAEVGPSDLVILVLLYGALAYALAAALRLSSRWGTLPAAACGSAVAGLAVWHLREQVGFPDRSITVLPIAVTLGATAALALRRRAGDVAPRRELATLVAATAALAVVGAASFELSDLARWRLLRHNRLLGTPIYFALGAPVTEVRSELFRHLEQALPRSAPAPASRLSPDSSQERPDIALILVDTLRADALSSWGGEPGWMPRTNDLARRSLVLSDVMANASWTRSSVASLMTGLLPEEHGALDRDDTLAASHATLAERLVALGYDTRAFVTNWAVAGVKGGFAQGFHDFRELRSPPYARAGEVVEEVERAFAGDDCAPCFVYVHLLDPHRPYRSGTPDSGSPIARLRGSYEAELRYLDRELSRLAGVLRGNLGEDLRIFFTADHGEEFHEHLDLGHGHALYDEVLHVPAFVHGPGIEPGVTEAPLELRDAYELILDLARGGARDVRTWARAHERQSRYASTYLTTRFRWHRPYRIWVAARRLERGRFTLIWSGYGKTWELYDRRSDPELRRNLIEQRPVLRSELEAQMDAAPRAWRGATAEAPTEEREEQLRALGYVK